MPQYTTTVTAASNASAGTEDAYVEISFAAASAGRIKRVHVSADTAASDARIKANLKRTSAAGATGTAGTAVRRDAQMRVSSSTVTVKNAAAAFTVGTLVDTPYVANLNGRSTYEWIPRNYMEELVVVGANRFVVGVVCSVASVSITVTVEWED
jgi:hypothetical protein